MFIVGEASGDTLGAELTAALLADAKSNGIEAPVLFGAGGPKMAEAGVDLTLDLAAHAVVGIVEVLRNYGKFKGFFDQLLNLAENRRPRAIILIDYPGFNLRFAKALRHRLRTLCSKDWNPKLIYYVSPQIWAWHESRVYQIAKDIDLMLTIFPFEKAWYAQRVPDFKVEFVGHPLVDRFPNPSESKPERTDPSRIVLLPGSRRRELTQHLPVLLSTIKQLSEERQITATLVLVNDRLAEITKQLIANLPMVRLQIGGLAEALQTADVAIAASGTVTMECAWFRVPTVVLYKTSWSTHWFGRRFIKVKYLAMPNLLANALVFPEFIQNEATPQNLSSAVNRFLDDHPYREQTQQQLAQTVETLGAPGASKRAAKAIFGLLGN